MSGSGHSGRPISETTTALEELGLALVAIARSMRGAPVIERDTGALPTVPRAPEEDTPRASDEERALAFARRKKEAAIASGRSRRPVEDWLAWEDATLRDWRAHPEKKARALLELAREERVAESAAKPSAPVERAQKVTELGRDAKASQAREREHREKIAAALPKAKLQELEELALAKARAVASHPATVQIRRERFLAELLDAISAIS